MVTATKIGLLHKLKQTYGLTQLPAKWIGLDGDASAESASQMAPAQELTTGGCGRVEAVVTDISTADDIAVKLVANYEFTAYNSINAYFVAWSSSPGNNMTARHKLSANQNVGPEDTMTIIFIDHEAPQA